VENPLRENTVSTNLRWPRLLRCLRAFYLLQSEFGFTTNWLADEFNVTTRTVFRDLQLLRDAGVPLRHDERLGGHVISPHVGLRLTGLSPDEFATLALAASMSPLANGHQFGGIVRQSIHKLMGQVNQDLRREVANLLKACVTGQSSPSFPTIDDQHERILARVLLAIRKRRCIRVVYAQHDHPQSHQQTKLSPYRLTVSPSRCYITGRSSVHRRIQTFDLHRITEAELTDDSYTVPLAYLRPAHLDDIDDSLGALCGDPDGFADLSVPTGSQSYAGEP